MADVVERYRIVGDNQVGRAFDQILRQSKATSDKMTAIFRGAFNLIGTGTAIYGLTRIVSSSIKAGDEIAKFAEKSGLAAEAASELAGAASMADVNLGSLETGIKTMQVTLSEAGSGTKRATDLLTSLGLEFDRIANLKPDQQFELIAEQISKLKNPTDRTRAAVEAFGRAGADLLPLFANGAAGIRKAREEMQALGKSFSAEDLKKFQAIDEAFKRMKTSGSALADTLALETAPAIAGTFDVIRMALGNLSPAEQLAMEIAKLEKMGAIFGENAERLARLKARLDSLLMPNNTGLGNRGRVFKDGEVPPGFSWLKTVEDQAKRTKEELAQLERFERLQQDMAQKLVDPRGRGFSLAPLRPEVAASEAAYLNQALGPSLEENSAAIAAHFRTINLENVELRERTIKISEAFGIAEESARGMMGTIKDELARRALGTLSDLVYSMGDGAKDFGNQMIESFRRILADQAARQLFSLLEGSGSGSGGIVGAIGRGIGSLFGLGSGSGGGGGGGGGGGLGGAFRGFAAEGMSLRPGEWAIAGETGKPEAVFGGKHGAEIVPFQKMAGSKKVTTINLNYAPSIDARGATVDLAKQLPKILAENNRQIWNMLRDQISRGAFST